jgi:hypothetical protein
MAAMLFQFWIIDILIILITSCIIELTSSFLQSFSNYFAQLNTEFAIIRDLRKRRGQNSQKIKENLFDLRTFEMLLWSEN